MDLSVLGIPLERFRTLAQMCGWRSIPGEAWHFEYGEPDNWGKFHATVPYANLGEAIEAAQEAYREIMFPKGGK